MDPTLRRHFGGGPGVLDPQPVLLRSCGFRYNEGHIVTFNVMHLTDVSFQLLLHRSQQSQVRMLVLQGTQWKFDLGYSTEVFHVIHTKASRAGKDGVMVLIAKSVCNSLGSIQVSAALPGRILTVRCITKPFGFSMVGGYAPQSQDPGEASSR